MADTLVTAEDLQMIVEQTWHAYLDSGDTAALEFQTTPGALVDVAAAVSISGAWRGHLVIGGSQSVATMVAAQLLDMPAEDVTAEDVSDGFGELANIVGGNVKALLPQPALLSLPRVLLSGLDAARYPGAEPVHVVHARWHGEPVITALLCETPH